MKLAITLLAFLFACTSQPDDKPQASKRDAGRALSTASALLDNINIDAVANRLLPSTATVDYTEPCPTSGSIRLDGILETTDDGQQTELDVTAGFLACTAGSEQIDGTVHWIQTIDGGTSTSMFDGTLTWRGPGGSASCTFDISVSNGTVTGTACGYDVEELDE